MEKMLSYQSVDNVSGNLNMAGSFFLLFGNSCHRPEITAAGGTEITITQRCAREFLS